MITQRVMTSGLMTICFVSPLPEQQKPPAKKGETPAYNTYKPAGENPSFGFYFIWLFFVVVIVVIATPGKRGAADKRDKRKKQ